MGDYVLESNPALGRLIERLGAEGSRSGPQESSRFHDSWRFQRRGRSKVPKRTRENSTTVDAPRRAAGASFLEPESIVEEPVVEDHLWAIREDLQDADEIVLVDFDEEPAVFEDERVDAEAFMEDDAAADEVLDVYGRADLEDNGESAYEDAEAFDEMDWLLEEDHDEDGASVRTVRAGEDAVGDWIFDAFKAWMREVDEAVA